MLFGICSTIANYETVKNAGYSAIGLAGKDVAAMSDSEFTQACGIIKAGSLRLSHFYAFCAPSVVLAGANYDPQALRQYTEKLFARGKELGVSYAGIGSPLSRVRPEGVSPEQMDAQMTDTLKLLCEIGDKYGIEILLEAVCVQSGCNYITGTEEVLKMTSALPGINMVYDIYHAYMMKEDAAPILKAGPRIKIAHLSGNIGETRGYLTKQNVSDYQPYVDALKKTGYAGELHIEASSGDVAQEAAPSLDVLRTLYGK
jgi:sugar phosphate isomerase/epimerase